MPFLFQRSCDVEALSPDAIYKCYFSNSSKTFWPELTVDELDSSNTRVTWEALITVKPAVADIQAASCYNCAISVAFFLSDFSLIAC